MRPLIVLAFLAALATPAAAAPEWCNIPELTRLAGSVARALEEDPYTALPELMAATCGKYTSAADHERLAAARAKWSQRLDLTDAEWREVAEWVVSSRRDRRRTHLANAANRTWSALSPLDQYAELLSHSDDIHYFADALALSEAGRLAYILRCLDMQKPVEWALCQPDIDAFDRKRLSAELRADKRGAYDRMVVRLALYGATKRLADRKQAIAALTDPAYAQVFALAAAARTEHGKRTDPEMRALALAMDDARISRSNRAYAGCEDRTWAAFAKAISVIPAKQFVGLKDEPGYHFVQSSMAVVANDPNAYLAAIALHACEAAKPDALIRAIGNALRRWPGFRGPRTTGLTAIAKAGLQLDDRSARLELPATHRSWLVGDESMGGGGRGKVAAVKGDTVVFVKKSHKERACASWRDNNKIIMFSASGSPIYGYDCLKYTQITVTTSSPPRAVKPRYKAGVKAGAYVSIAEDVVGVVARKPGEAPTHVLGVPVK